MMVKVSSRVIMKIIFTLIKSFNLNCCNILKKIKKEFPYLHVYLYETSSQKQKKALESGKLDLGILRAPIFTTNLQILSLFKDSFCLATPKGWKKDINAITLMQEDFISYNPLATSSNMECMVLHSCAI